MDTYKKDGYLVLEGFFTDEEVKEMREAGEKLTEDIPDEDKKKSFADSKSENQYLIESSDKIRCFFESSSLVKGDESKASINKVGHALHWLHPVFRKYTFCDKIKMLCDKVLDLEEPCVVQSMYIYKNPNIGDEVGPHQDSSYLYTKPESKLYGFWIALEDATIDNGCPWFAPGSHTSGAHRRFIRNPDKTSEDLLIYTSPQPIYPSSNFKAVPVKKGTLILIHGLVVQIAWKPKGADKSRHAYVFHVVDFDEGTYSEENWLQPTPDLPFPCIYENR